MNIFFDCDYTIISWDSQLRPGIPDLFQKLKDDGHVIYVWSGAGIRWYDLRKHNLESYVQDCFHKPLYDYRRRMIGLGVTLMPDIVIDDYPDIVSALGGIRVKPFVSYRGSDREAETIYHIIKALSSHYYPSEAYSLPDYW